MISKIHNRNYNNSQNETDQQPNENFSLRKNMAGNAIIVWIAILGIFACSAAAAYDLPDDNSGCPSNCRQVPWSAGSDQWNGGILPHYTSVKCNGLAGNGATNDGPAIQACINTAAPNTAVDVPAGTYYINSDINLKDNVVLRGAKLSSKPYLPSVDSTATTFKLGSNGAISFSGGSTGSNIGISSGYTKGSKTLVMSSGHGFAAGDWILISENPDTSIPVTKNGDIGSCTWCGENDGTHLMAQFAQVTAVNSNTITISRPMYYTFKSSLSPVARKVTMGTKYAGLENIRLDGSHANHDAFIYMGRTLFCWVKGVETYNAGSGAKASHVQLEWSHGAEIRESYFHLGRDSSSDRNYGIALMFSNSDHKIENNIMREHRHSIDFEGGGAGVAVLYNYIDDDYTDDTSYLGSARANHGAHPYMNLYEGNIISHIVADSYWGSSSHNVFFRNALWGDETGNIPKLPDWAFYPIDVWYNQNYYSFVGNVLGKSSGHVDWSKALLATTKSSDCSSDPVIYRYGCDSDGNWNSAARATSINHGNYDYKTKGVAYWEGGTDHTLKSSIYYASKPAFFGSIAWPPIGPDISGYTNKIPAQLRFEGVDVPSDTCSQAGGTCCSSGQQCSGTQKSVSDCTICCVGTCQSQQAQTCSQAGGTCCSSGQTCSGTAAAASDCSNCCVGTCSQQTCSQQGGTCCATSQTCTGTTKTSSDCSSCCVGTCQTTCIPGDLNCDKKVDIFDLVLVAQNYGKASGFDTRADANKDGKIDIFDLVVVAQNYGK